MFTKLEDQIVKGLLRDKRLNIRAIFEYSMFGSVKILLILIL